MNGEMAVELAFAVRGTAIPADHGFALYGAVSRAAPALHGDARVGIHPVMGQPAGGRQLALTRGSRLVLRLPASLIPEALRLAGARLDVAGQTVQVGVPVVRPLRPAAAVWSRLVVVQGFMEAEGFLEAVRRQLGALGVQGRAMVMARSGERAREGRSSAEAGTAIRRTIRIHDKEVVGFAVQVAELTAEESVRLQEAGVGGRRRFGCGVFIPAVR